ncbi:hypothetical protein EV356DRAFT_135913 [Viridothelium virens]|uniref:Uncharacterized protein n=1 Tax=Viridothelium virens TaxID=1048519 RepID=A0A6A6HBG8_VIRVR|nr:hypothetical protein EV356DRAFT_135913 [Viridothelium virens]
MFNMFLTESRKLWLIWTVLQLVAVCISESPTCYHLDGTPFPNDGTPLPGGNLNKWVPCNPDHNISHCCNGVDLCLDNGLCMDFGPAGGVGDRLFTLQGCTDPNWGPPCPQYFAEDPNKVPGADGRVLLWACSYDSGGEYCVGTPKLYGAVGTWDASCCADASRRIKTIPWFRSIHLAMDPSQRIEVWQGNNAGSEDRSSDGQGNDGKASQSSNGTSAGVGVVIGVLGALFAFCQWQFPKWRILRLLRFVFKKIRQRKFSRAQAANDLEEGIHRVSTRSMGRGYDVESQTSYERSYRDSPRESLDIGLASRA